MVYPILLSLLLSFKTEITEVATEPVLWKSADSGITWQTIGQELPQGFFANIIQENGSRLMIGSEKGTFVLENDIWKTETALKDIMNVFTCKSGTYVRSYQSGLMKIVDGQPVPVFSALDARFVRSLTETADGEFYVGSERGLFKSSEHGTVWTPLLEGASMTLVQGPDGLLVVGSDNGLQKSSDGGKTWVSAYADHATIRDIKVNGQQMVALSYEAVPFSEQNQVALSFLKQNARVREKAAISNDGGKTWSKLNLPAIDMASSIDVISANGQLFCSMDNRIFRSANYGQTWQHLMNTQKVEPIKLSVLNGIIYAVRSFSGC